MELADAAAIAARLILYLGAFLVIGRVALGWFTQERTPDVAFPPAPLADRWGSAALLTGVLLLLAGQKLALDLPWGESIELLADTTWGRGWMLLVSAALVAVVGLQLHRTPWVATVGALAVAIQMGALGHSGADEQWPLVSRALDGVHVLAVSSWLGGLALIRSPHTPFARWTAYSRMATIAAPLAVLSGAGLSWRRLSQASLGEIIGSDYGRLLGAKIALALVILAFGARHRRRVHAGTPPSHRGVTRELLVALLVGVLTAVLTGTEPPY